MALQHEYEPSSLPFLFPPVFFVSLIVGLLCTYVISPIIGALVVPQSKNFSGKDKSLFNTLLSSTLHAVVATALSTYILIYGLLGTNRLFSLSPAGFTAMQISFGYFVQDFFVVLMDPHLRKDSGSVVHHIAGIIGIFLGLLHQGRMMFFIVYRMIAESSTPFVNTFHLLRMTGNKESKWYLFTSAGMMITFFLFRVVVIPWHWFELINTAAFNPEIDKYIPVVYRIWLGINYAMFDVLNVYWFAKMIQGAVKLYKEKRG